jgi:membrane dipeptidase
MWYVLGARYLTLTHSATLDWADSATDAPRHGGLAPFGVQVVQEMARLGMMVDLSHVSEETMHDAMDASGAPVIFSHSGARAINGHPRNVPDSVLERLPQEGGIVMVVGLPAYLSEAVRQHGANRSAEQARLNALFSGQPEQVATRIDEWDRANPAPQATVSDMADHIDHIRVVAGIDHIGIGGDYDGMAVGPVGMEEARLFPARPGNDRQPQHDAGAARGRGFCRQPGGHGADRNPGHGLAERRIIPGPPGQWCWSGRFRPRYRLG